jgi:hypothetical protein
VFLSLTSNNSPRRIMRSLTFRIEGSWGFYEFPRRDLDRLKDKTAWLSDSHIDFAIQCVSLNMLLTVYLSQTGIFSSKVWAKYLPQARICRFYHARSGPSFLRTQKSSTTNIDQGSACWNGILSSCLCMGGRYIN